MLSPSFINLVRILARLAPPVAAILAVAFLVAAAAVVFLGVGGYAAADARLVGLLLVVFALVAFAIGRMVPAFVRWIIGRGRQDR